MVALITLAYIAFISLGLPDGLLGVAWPTMRLSYGRSLDSLGVLLIATTAGYLTSSFFSGQLITRLGVGGLLAASCAATGICLVGYILVPYWWMITVLMVVAGLGAGAIDAGINTYIASHFGSRQMQWLHASYGIGATLGPVIMTIGINFFSTWRIGYALVGAAQMILAICFLLTMRLWKQDGLTAPQQDQKLTDYKTPLALTLRQPRVWLSTIMFFFYTGIEVTLGCWAYTLLTESRGINPQTAGLWTGSYWATFTISRIAAGLYTKHIKLHNLVRISLLLAFTGSLILWWNPTPLASLIGVVLVGIAVAPVFPSLVSGTSARVDREHAANTIGLQIGAAGFGAAILPGLVGVLAQRTSLEIVPLCLMVFTVILLTLYTRAIVLERRPGPAI